MENPNLAFKPGSSVHLFIIIFVNDNALLLLPHI